MSRHNGPAWVTFIVGAGVGAAAALLFAPKTRINQVRNKVNRVGRRAQGLADRVTEQVREAATTGENAYNATEKD